MNKKDILYTLSVLNKKVDIGFDEPGQCYYFEYEDDNGDRQVESCGAYNDDVIEYIIGFFDKKGLTISLYDQEYWDRETDSLIDDWLKKGLDKKHPDDFNKLVEKRYTSNYQYYNIEKICKDFRASLGLS